MSQSLLFFYFEGIPQWYEKKAMETLSYKNCASDESLEVIDKINIIIIINIHL